MIYNHPTKRNENAHGYTESYHFENEVAKLNIGTITAGYKDFFPTQSKRFYYIKHGIGNAIKGSNEYVLTDNVTLDFPSNCSFRLEGQMKFIEVTGDTSTKVVEINDSLKFDNDNNSHLLYIIDGLAFAKFENFGKVVREDSFIEVPKNSQFELKGKVKAILVDVKD